jgi:hypothetical protein
VLAKVDNRDPYDDRPGPQQNADHPALLPRGGGRYHRKCRMQRGECGIQVVVVVGVQPNDAGRQPLRWIASSTTWRTAAGWASHGGLVGAKAMAHKITSVNPNRLNASRSFV